MEQGIVQDSAREMDAAIATRIEPLPNFFIVGAPKCATTSMDYYLGQHPEIFMCPSKEPHYFAEDLYPGDKRCPAERYFGFFEGAESEPILGESDAQARPSPLFAAADGCCEEGLHRFELALAAEDLGFLRVVGAGRFGSDCKRPLEEFRDFAGIV